MVSQQSAVLRGRGTFEDCGVAGLGCCKCYCRRPIATGAENAVNWNADIVVSLAVVMGMMDGVWCCNLMSERRLDLLKCMHS